MAVKALQPFSRPAKPARRFWRWGRLWDALALLAIAFVAYRLLVAPRSLAASAAIPEPHVSYATLDAKPFVLTAHRGRVVFLEFWATWCEPCKAQMPLVESFARHHPEVDVELVDVGEPRIAVEAYVRPRAIANVAIDPLALSRGFFQIEGFPTMVLIDRGGRIRATWTGFNPAVALNMAAAVQSLREARRSSV